MDNYYLYYTEDRKAEEKGLALLNTGFTRIEKNSCYPPAAHPAHHNFSWQQGRVLEEYQLIHITRGGGLFESERSSEEITQGTIILLRPGERHRYRPYLHCGWEETWVGFRGHLIDAIVRGNDRLPDRAAFRVGHPAIVARLFNDIDRFSREKKTGYQPVISGAILYLMGLIAAGSRETTTEPADRLQGLVRQACTLFRERVYGKISPEQVAEELQVSYSLFRKAFKKYTGVAPGQYLIGLRIQLAKELLADPDKLVKEIAYELNMGTPLYLCKQFKEKVGLTPLEYRRQLPK